MVFRNNINSCEVLDAIQDNHHSVNMVGKTVIVLFCTFQVSCPSRGLTYYCFNNITLPTWKLTASILKTKHSYKAY